MLSHLTETPNPGDLPSQRIALLDAFLSNRSARTLESYRDDLRCFREFCGTPTPQAAVAGLVQMKPGDGNALVLQYRAYLAGLGRSPATICRRLSTLRSLLRLARLLGVVNWTLEVPSPKRRTYRDTRGPGVEGIRKMWAELEKRHDAKGVRDRAIFRLLFDLALRRAEIVGLDTGDVDLTRGTVEVRGKGETEKENPDPASANG